MCHRTGENPKNLGAIWYPGIIIIIRGTQISQMLREMHMSVELDGGQTKSLSLKLRPNGAIHISLLIIVIIDWLPNGTMDFHLVLNRLRSASRKR